MATTNEQVKDAAEALAAAIQEVSFELHSSTNSQHQRNTDVIMESLRNSNEIATDTMKKYNENFNSKMGIINEHLSALEGEIKVNSSMLQSTMKESFENVCEMAKTSNENLAINMQSVDRHLTAIENEAKINSAISQEIKDFHNGIKREIDAMNRHLESLQSDVSAVKAILEAQDKQRKFEFQISCADVCSFPCYSGVSTIEMESSELVTWILKRFALGQGCEMRADLTTIRSSDCEKGRKEFREKLKKQMNHIMGHEPYIEKKDDEWYSIYYEP